MKKRFFFAIILVASLMSGSTIAQMLPTVATDVSPMLVGETIPDATIVSASGNSVSLYSLIKQKPTVIVFYRGVWCPNCIKNFQEEFKPNLAEIERSGYNLITICPDTPTSLMETSKQTGMESKYFYGDPTGELSKAMGLAFKQNERMSERLLGSSDGKNTDLYLPVPAVYIVGVDNEIIFADIRPNGISSAKRIKWRLLGAVLQAYK